jgi:hypothetical protein
MRTNSAVPSGDFVAWLHPVELKMMKKDVHGNALIRMQSQ